MCLFVCVSKALSALPAQEDADFLFSISSLKKDIKGREDNSHLQIKISQTSYAAEALTDEERYYIQVDNWPATDVIYRHKQAWANWLFIKTGVCGDWSVWLCRCGIPLRDHVREHWVPSHLHFCFSWVDVGSKLDLTAKTSFENQWCQSWAKQRNKSLLTSAVLLPTFDLISYCLVKKKKTNATTQNDLILFSGFCYKRKKIIYSQIFQRFRTNITSWCTDWLSLEGTSRIIRVPTSLPQVRATNFQIWCNQKHNHEESNGF